MKILHLTDETWDSGLTAYSIQVGRLFKDAGHDVRMGVRPGKIPEKLAKEAGLVTIPVQNFFDLARALQSEAWDVVNPHTGRTHTWTVMAYLLRKPHPQPAIVRTRGDARVISVNFGSRFVYRHTHAVIALSDHIRRQYERGFHLAEDRLCTIYPSLKADETISDSPQQTVGILGRLDPVKGHTIFLDAVARVVSQNPKATFLVAGKEANVTIGILQNQAKQLGVLGSIQFIGHHPDALQFLRSCSIGVIASIGSEEVSRVCLEWMSVGRPVVGTLVGCLPELIDTDETGFLVPPGDSVALGDAILTLLKDESTRSRMGKVAHEIIRKKFSGKIQLEKTLDIYQSAIQRARAGHGQ